MLRTRRPDEIRASARDSKALLRGFAVFISTCAALAILPAHGTPWLPCEAKCNTAAFSPFVHRVQSEALDFDATDVAGAPGQPIALDIKIRGQVSQNSGQLFIFTGIPDGIKLSAGGYFSDFWAVTSKDVANLTLTAPQDYTGSFEVKITRARNQALSARSKTIKVTIATGALPATAAARESAPEPGPTTPTATQRDANEGMLMARAADRFKAGDVSGARVIFEYLAARGNPAAAIAMGETYDPVILSKLFIKGLEADAAKAQLWYEKADELGSDEARARLNALAAR
jgi:hypothetical protein